MLGTMSTSQTRTKMSSWHLTVKVRPTREMGWMNGERIRGGGLPICRCAEKLAMQKSLTSIGSTNWMTELYRGWSGHPRCLVSEQNRSDGRARLGRVAPGARSWRSFRGSLAVVVVAEITTILSMSYSAYSTKSKLRSSDCLPAVAAKLRRSRGCLISPLLHTKTRLTRSETS